MNTRVLVLAPTLRDANVTHEALKKQMLRSVVCRNIDELLREAESGIATILMTDESFRDPSLGTLLRFIIEQPGWSDLPVVLLLHGSAKAAPTADIVRLLGNVTLLERPAPMRTVTSAVKVAVRSRMRQYLIRDQIEQLRAADEEKQHLLRREQEARGEAERASRLKDEFLATLSHELRTPLSAILGWSHVLMRSNATADSLYEGLAAIERNARSQAALIADLLDMSRIMLGKVRISTRSIDLYEVIRAAIESVRPSADAKNVQLAFSCNQRIDPINGDPNRLQQVVWNLLTNAVKFTPTGGHVLVRLMQFADATEFSVADSGKGIDPAFLPHVFERFRQADSSTTRAHGGLGLGLAIVKQLVEMHGGTVSVASPGEGRGSTFVVQLPRVGPIAQSDQEHDGHMDESSRKPTSLRPEATLDGLRVLVVDDEPDARRLIELVLADAHAEVVTVASADEALMRLKEFNPEVIVSDIGMPQQDGYELLSNIRARGIGAPAIALTAFARTEDRARSLQAGFQEHMNKPVEPRELLKSVARVSGRPSGIG